MLKIWRYGIKFAFCGRRCHLWGHLLFELSICSRTIHRFWDSPISSGASAARVEELCLIFDLWDFEIYENCNLSSQIGFPAIFSLEFRFHFRINLEDIWGSANHILLSETYQAGDLIFALIFLLWSWPRVLRSTKSWHFLILAPLSFFFWSWNWSLLHNEFTNV